MKPYKVFRPVGTFHEELMDVLVYKTPYELMYSLARFQEYYENPCLAGKKFTRLDLQNWQPDYYSCWQGCNFPPSVVTEFHSGRWDLDEHEKAAIENMSDGKYIIGVSLESDMIAVIAHERCHALYYANNEYKQIVDRFFSVFEKTIPEWKVPIVLKDAGYGDNVIIDEFQAYLITGEDKFFDPSDTRYSDFINYVKKNFSKELRLED